MQNRKDLKPVENPKDIFRTTMEYTDNAMLCHFNPTTEKSPSSKLLLLTNVRAKVGDESVNIKKE